MTMPAPLRGWAPFLAGIHEELAQALVGLVEPVSAFLAALRFSFDPGEGEPEGFDGLSNKGNFDLLLASEWLLADVFPDEFLRRASNREQLFLRRELRQSKGKRLSVALFDSGPHQLGNPRLVQLALIFVFARRAMEAGGSFLWGTLQDGTCQLWETWDCDGIKAFLGARSIQVVGEEHLERWTLKLEALELAPTANWVVGLPEEKAFLPGWSRIHITDIAQPGSQNVGLRVVHNRRSLELMLPLPEPTTRTWLLRDPFKSNLPAIASDGLKEQGTFAVPRVVVDAPRAKLMFQYSERRFCILKVPTSAYGFSRVRAMGTIPAEHTLLGMFLKGREFYLLTKKNRWLYLIPGRVGKSARTFLDQATIIKNYNRAIFRPQKKLISFQVMSRSSKSTRDVLVLASTGDLFRLKWRGSAYVLKQMQKNTTNLKRWSDWFYLTKSRGGGRPVELSVFNKRLSDSRTLSLTGESGGQILFPNQAFNSRIGLAFAFNQGNNCWRVDFNQRTITLEIEPHICPIAMFHTGYAQRLSDTDFYDPNRIFLLGLDSSRRVLYGLGHKSRILFESDHLIHSAHVCTEGDVVALFLNNGQLEIREPRGFKTIYSIAIKDLA